MSYIFPLGGAGGRGPPRPGARAPKKPDWRYGSLGAGSSVRVGPPESQRQQGQDEEELAAQQAKEAEVRAQRKARERAQREREKARKAAADAAKLAQVRLAVAEAEHAAGRLRQPWLGPEQKQKLRLFWPIGGHHLMKRCHLPCLWPPLTPREAGWHLSQRRTSSLEEWRTWRRSSRLMVCQTSQSIHRMKGWPRPLRGMMHNSKQGTPPLQLRMQLALNLQPLAMIPLSSTMKPMRSLSSTTGNCAPPAFQRQRR